jgi:hypothetical protein
MNRNMQPKIHRSATTYSVQNSISDTLRNNPQRNRPSVKFAERHPLGSEGQYALAFLSRRLLFGPTLLQGQQSFGFPFQRTDELRPSQGGDQCV